MSDQKVGSPTVLVVEDEPRIRELLSETLKKKGFMVDHARNGEIGFEKFEKNAPDILITDLMLPKLDGFQLVEKARNTKQGKEIPIIIMSAVYRDTEIQDQFNKDFRVDFLVKPFSLVDFLNKLHNASLVTLLKQEAPQRKLMIGKKVNFDYKVKDFGFSEEELRWFKQIDRSRNARELFALAIGKVQNFYLTLWALLILDAVEVFDI